MGMTDDEVRARIAAVPHRYHPIEVRPGIITPGANAARTVLGMLDLPADCRGMRALDLGTRDGWGPNVRCVEEMLGKTEFAARRVVRIGDRCVFACEVISSPAAAYYMQIATGRRAPEGVSS